MKVKLINDPNSHHLMGFPLRPLLSDRGSQLGLQQKHVAETIQSRGELFASGRYPSRRELRGGAHGGLELRDAAQQGPGEHLDTQWR